MSTPNYMKDFPPIIGLDYLTDTEFSMGMINWLYKIADRHIESLFGGYDFQVNEDDVLDFDDLKVFEGNRAIVYASVWLAMALLFTITSIIWCVRNIRCCNVCKKADMFGEKEKKEPPKFMKWLRKLANFTMPVYLLLFLLMILVTIGGNQKLREGLGEVEEDVKNSVSDFRTYLIRTDYQFNYTFNQSYVKFNETVRQLLGECEDDPSGDTQLCGELSLRTLTALSETKQKLEGDMKVITAPLHDVMIKVNRTDDRIDEGIKDSTNAMKSGVYWVLFVFNLLYLVLFGLTLAGSVQVIKRKRAGEVQEGNMLLKISTVIMIFVRILIVVQIIVMFYVGGIVTQVLCPAVRELEGDAVSPSTTPASLLLVEDLLGQEQTFQYQVGQYQVPRFGEIFRQCKSDEPAYQTFALGQVFNISSVDEIREKFANILPPPSSSSTSSSNNSSSSSVGLLSTPEETAASIRSQAGIYVDFIKQAVGMETGKCLPVYTAIDGTLESVCYKAAGPFIAYWWILQAIAIDLMSVTITAMILERY